MRHTGQPLSRTSMVVEFEHYGLEARFWIVSELPTAVQNRSFAYQRKRFR